MALTEKLVSIADAIRLQSGKGEKLTLDQMAAQILDLQNLNFDVVGNPQPANPKENTIWVDTDDAITSWMFSAAEPEAPVEGMVWIRTGTAGTTEFNALKKNSIQVYPLSVKQYAGGAWVDKDAKIYRGGAWADIVFYLFNLGGQAAFSEKWTSVGKRFTNSSQVPTSVQPATITYHADGSVLIRSSTGGGSFTYYKEMIDVTDHKTLTFEGNVYGDGSWTVIALYESMPAYTKDEQVASVQVGYGASGGTFSIDVSNLSGKHYIGFVLYSNNSTDPYFEMKRMKLV